VRSLGRGGGRFVSVAEWHTLVSSSVTMDFSNSFFLLYSVEVVEQPYWNVDYCAYPSDTLVPCVHETYDILVLHPCTVPMNNCNATGNSRIPTRRFNKLRSFIGSPFTSVLHELGRPTRLPPRMSFRSFPHCAYHFLIRHTSITSAPCTSHLSVNFNGANRLCLYKPNHTTNYQRRYQCTSSSYNKTN